MEELLRLFQQAAVEAGESTYPMKLLFGVVMEESPLQILRDQRLLLSRDLLYLSSAVSKREMVVEVHHQTESTNCGDGPHSHAITGMKTVVVHTQLKKGEQVLMLRMQGGQRFLVLDRVVRP